MIVVFVAAMFAFVLINAATIFGGAYLMWVGGRKHCEKGVPEEGLEPSCPLRAPDFESGASANSATPAGAVIVPRIPAGGTARWVFDHMPASRLRTANCGQ